MIYLGSNFGEFQVRFGVQLESWNDYGAYGIVWFVPSGCRGNNPKTICGALLKAADLVEKHLASILAHWKSDASTVLLKNRQSVLSAAERKTFGYHSTMHLIRFLNVVTRSYDVKVWFLKEPAIG